jgi:hypothetical protein
MQATSASGICPTYRIKGVWKAMSGFTQKVWTSLWETRGQSRQVPDSTAFLAMPANCAKNYSKKSMVYEKSTAHKCDWAPTHAARIAGRKSDDE